MALGLYGGVRAALCLLAFWFLYQTILRLVEFDWDFLWFWTLAALTFCANRPLGHEFAAFLRPYIRRPVRWYIG